MAELDLDSTIVDTAVTVDPIAQRRLAMHAVEYCDRNHLSREVMDQLVSMLGLKS